MDWDAYAENKELFEHLTKYSELIFCHSDSEKKERSLTKRLDMFASDSYFSERYSNLYFAHLDPGRSFAFKVWTLKKSNVFNLALHITCEITQKGYLSALDEIDRRNERDSENHQFTSKDYPPTIEQFKNDSIKFLIERGLVLDMAKLAKEESVIKSVKKLVRTFIDAILGSYEATRISAILQSRER